MPIDSNIFFQTKLPEDNYDQKNLLAARQTRLADLGIAEKERELRNANALSTALESGQTDLGKFGMEGLKITEKAKDIEKLKNDIAKQKLAAFTELVSQRVQTPDDYSKVTSAMFDDPEVGPMLQNLGLDRNSELSKIQGHAKNGTFNNYLLSQKIAADQFYKKHYSTRDLGNVSEVTAFNPYTGERQVVQSTAIGASPNKPSTVVNVNTKTENEYNKEAAKAVAKKDNTLIESADTAYKALPEIQRVSKLLNSNKVFTGTGAEVKLQIAKALKLAGVSDSEMISNTESLIQQQSKLTLDSIKSSGLGSGNGFTNTDREFLEKAVGGTANLDVKTIKGVFTAIINANRALVIQRDRLIDKDPGGAYSTLKVDRLVPKELDNDERGRNLYLAYSNNPQVQRQILDKKRQQLKQLGKLK